MKKLAAILLTVLMLICLTACGTAVSEDRPAAEQTPVEEAPVEEAPVEEATVEEPANGIRPEFQQAMDEYEAFYDEYVAFMKKYTANPTDMTLLAEYASMMQKLTEMDNAFTAWESEALNSAELQYYIEVNGRVAQKLLDAAM